MATGHTMSESDSDRPHSLELDEHEQSVAQEELIPAFPGDQMTEGVVPDNVTAAEDLSIVSNLPEVDPIVAEFGGDGGVINLAMLDHEYFFFVETSGIVTNETSYFASLDHYWQMLKIIPATADGLPLVDDDPNTVFAELYIPDSMMNLGEQEILEFKERGMEAIRLT